MILQLSESFMTGNRKLNKWNKVLCAFLAVIICLSAGAKWFVSAESDSYSEALDVLSGKTAGVLTGTPQDKFIQDNVQNVQLAYYNNSTDLAIALQTKKIDFFSLSSVNYYCMAEQYPEFGYLDVTLTTFDIGTIFPKTDKGKVVCDELNEYIAEIKESGELSALQEYWLFPNDWENFEIPKTGEKGVLKMATANTFKPFSFMLNGENAGFDIAVIAGFCSEYGYGLEIENIDFAGALSGIAAGKYDLAAGQIAWTEERSENVLYSDLYYTQQMVPILIASDVDSPYLVTASSSDTGNGETGSTGSETTKHKLINSIRRTLIDEDRWISLLRGLLMTLWITVAGFVLANLMGILFCMMSMSRYKVLKVISRIYSGLMQGLPVVVILMILYYIIFGHSKVSNITVAILGFGFVFGAYMAQLFEGGICSVEKGQWEAALSVGLTKRQAFFGIVLPQATRTMLAGYFSNLISLMKGTAIVGYIAVTDLTKAGDIIRSNTYEAFVPLIIVALLYFAAACILIAIMNLIRKRLSRRYTKK